MQKCFKSSLLRYSRIRSWGARWVASIIVLFFGSPVRIYVFSNMGYLASIAVALFGYFLYRQYRPDLPRPVRLPTAAKWVALAMAIIFTFIWAYGGWHSPALVVGENSERLFFLGLVILLAYLPLYWWRVITDRRLLRGGATAAVGADDGSEPFEAEVVA